MERRLLLKRKQASRLEIEAPEQYRGKTFNVTALYNGAQCAPFWSITSGNEYATINQNGRIDIDSSARNVLITIRADYRNRIVEKTITVSYDAEFQVLCPDTITGSEGTFYVIYDGTDVTQDAVYDTVGDAHIDDPGVIRFEHSEIFTFYTTYNDVTLTKTVTLIYDENTTTRTEVDPDTGETTTTTTTEVTDPSTGETTTTQTEVTEHSDGSTTTTQSETTTYDDGSSETTSTTTNSNGTSSSTTSTTSAPDPETGDVTTESNTTYYDENGDSTGTSETTLVNHDDGSSTSSTINYDTNGDPTTAENQDIDIDGNSSVQNITYDSNGDPIVSGYDIDTSNNPDGEKNFNEDGVNTEFYGFDEVDGFIMRLHFTIDFTDQPANQDENHHNILCMKRANPDPWYGFQLRQSSTNKYIQLGTQFEFGSNTNTRLNPTSWIVENQIAEYDIQVIYDPTLYNNTFVATNLLNGNTIYTSNYLFPDIPELRYLTVCLGCALDANGEPYRYSNINVLDFSIAKIQRTLAEPVITCDGQTITMSCSTTGSNIYYRLNQTGSFVAYTSPISIYSDTVVQAYSTLLSLQSETVSQLCEFDDGLESPIIECDGESVSITCGTPSADIYYRLGTTGDWIEYTEPIEINATTVVQAYSDLSGHHSDIVQETCVYVPVVLATPVISCVDNEVTITCSTIRSVIHYRTDPSDPWVEYTEPITISETTTFYAYSTYKNQTSSIVSQECEYTPSHDYSQDYLTFRVLTSGTILWKAIGNLTKTIEYSVNNGSWISLTSASAGAAINVSENDVVRLRGNNTTYATSKSAYSGFDGGTATFDIEGNIHSLLYGDNFASNSSLTNSTFQFCSIFKQSGVRSAENLILPALSLTKYCYRAMFSKATSLIVAPALPATTLSEGCYYYMFEECAFEVAPDLLAVTIAKQSYYYMFTSCRNLNFIRCLATSGVTTGNCQGWTTNVSGSGIFIKDGNTSWTIDSVNGIPIGWTVYNDVLIYAPHISFDGETIELSCQTPNVDIYYRLDGTGSFLLYSSPITISQDTNIEAYATDGTHDSPTSTMSCIYVEETIYEQSNKTLSTWTYAGNTITTPYSVNRIDGHSSNYAKGTFNFETSVNLRSEQPTYLWFQHADQKADIYVDDVLADTHWGGYAAFFSDISNYVHRGTNTIKVALKNNNGSTLAPAAGDFNFNATLGNVKLFTSPYLPDMKYGYDGMHITSSIIGRDATFSAKTTVPSGADVTLTISDSGSIVWTDTVTSDGNEIEFTDTLNDITLWHGKDNPYLYDFVLEISYNGDLYHKYTRPYGFRSYEYVVNTTVNNASFTGFLLNGEPYQLRGVCMHDDKDGKANALTDSDYVEQFTLIQELGCNFLRLAHYPHPKEVYDWCDQLGIIVQTEAPCVNKLQSTMPAEYYTHLTGQYRDMVNQHYNHPCIMFWGLSNETSTDDKTFGKAKVEEYTSLIRSLDSERLVGYVLSHSYNNPSSYYNDPDVDWFGANIYVGWYIDKASNDPTSQLNTRINNTITRLSKPLAFSEYGAGGTQHCHSDNPQTTTTTGNYARHDIEYQMWLHEGHIAAIRNFPQLLFTAEWQLFDIAVSNRNEGYTVCLDGENSSTDDNLRRLNNKGLVERDHVTKKDTFYIYKAEWNSTPFIHICGKDYTKMLSREIKCYTNAGNTASLYINNVLAEQEQVSNHIVVFSSQDFNLGDVVRVECGTSSDTFTFA